MDFSLPIPYRKSPVKNSDLIFSSLHLPIERELDKRKISSQIDLALGFNIKKIEETLRARALKIAPETHFVEWGPILHHGAQTWVGLDFQILQSTYHDLKNLFDIIKPKPFHKIVDLGAGYGRLGIFLHHFYSPTHFLGLELVLERVQEANRIYKLLGVVNKEMQVGDLARLDDLPMADIYFIYDFGSQDHMKKILELLKLKKNCLLVVKGVIFHNLMLKDYFFGHGQKVKKLEDIYFYYL